MLEPIQAIDFYKADHRRQYPKGVTKVYSNWTPRGSRIPGCEEVVFYGLQGFLISKLEEAFNQNFFKRNEEYTVNRYQTRMDRAIPGNNIGVEHIRELHKLGYIPLRFCAVPEGTLVPLRIPMMTVENTHPDFAWVTNYFETLISAELWKPCTSATISFLYRKILDKYAQETGDESFVPWQGHDFSFRGMDGVDSAARSGAAHLISFYGTDTIPALEWVEEYYEGYKCPILGGSVAATEHSVMCAGGKETELETFSRLIDLYPTGIVSIVSDTWDLWNVITNILPKLKEKILNRDGKLVIRPDSGDPCDILCGLNTSNTKAVPPMNWGCPSDKGVIELLWDIFGGTINEKGYKVLDSHIGAIYGDSITLDRANEICARLKKKGFASTNVVLGIGSYTFQYNTRDTFGFAIKATYCERDGMGYNLFKKPITDSGEKFSAKGRLAVNMNPETGKLYCIEEATPEQESLSLLKPKWINGQMCYYETFQDIRNNLAQYRR